MKLLTLDFETYYDAKYSLRKMTIAEYLHDPRFRVHGLAIRHPDGKCEFRQDIPEVLSGLQKRYGERLETVTVVGHNLYFDLYILNRVYGLSPAYFVDTMLLAYHAHGRPGAGQKQGGSLAALAERYGLQAKGELDFMSGVLHPDPRQSADLRDYAVNDVKLTYALALRLLPELSHSETEIPLMMHTVRLFTERGLHIDTTALDILRNTMAGDLAAKLTAAGLSQEEASGDKKFCHRLSAALGATGRSMPTKPGKNGDIPALAKDDEAMQRLAQDDDPAVAALATARLACKSTAQLRARLDTLTRIIDLTGGTLPPYLVYCGAHTHRFSGGQKFNIQNLGGADYGSALRKLIVPAPGCVFLCADLAQIEARVLAWYAGEQDLLCAFAEGRDIYCEFASRVFDYPVHKPIGDEPVEEQEQLRALRQVGKRAILGLGFGMGTKLFHEKLRSDPLTAPYFPDSQEGRRGCRDVVNSYREAYPGVPALWKGLEQGFKDAVEGAHWRGYGLHFQRRDGGVDAVLPSTCRMRYPNTKVHFDANKVAYIDEDGDEVSSDIEGERISYGGGLGLYGGKLVENIVQSTARDLFVESILRIEKEGFKVLFHVHDEVVVEVEKERSREAEERIRAIMETVPGWATGLPVSVEIRECLHYGK